MRKNNFKVKQVTIAPKWWLKIKGRLYAKRGKEVCDEYVHHLAAILASYEADETLHAEEKLHPSRTEAKLLLRKLPEKKVEYDSIPSDVESKDPDEIRANRLKAAKRGSITASVNSHLDRISEIDEEIINEETVMNERIHKLRSLAAKKVHVFIEGVRLGGLNDYSYEWNHEDRARTIYHAKHDELDSKIHALAS